jgi:hypothetical protein
MKKYRSLWYMSTTNHNILYFAVNPCTSLLNTGICLWKAQNNLVWRGFLSHFASKLVQIGQPPGPSRSRPGISDRPVLIPKPSPRREPLQDAKQVHFTAETVGVVDNHALSLDDPGRPRGSWRRTSNGPRLSSASRNQVSSADQGQSGDSRTINTFSLWLLRTLNGSS